MIRTLFALAFLAEVLDNAAVIRLARAGLSPDIILLKIEQSEARFDVSTDALIALKSAGVSDAVIKAMMTKTPSAPPPRTTPGAAICVKLTLYALGNNGWGWMPASACVNSTELSVDEQAYPFSQLAVQCIEPEARISFLGRTSAGETTWRFSDDQESFELRGKPEEVHKLSDALAAAAPALPHGKCSEGSIRALLKTQPRRLSSQ